jgi:hypothetical protein
MRSSDRRRQGRRRALRSDRACGDNRQQRRGRKNLN